MLFILSLFNKTIKPLHQFAKKKKKKIQKKSVLGATVLGVSSFLTIYFSNFFSVTHVVLSSLALCKVSKKDKTITSMLHINAQD